MEKQKINTVYLLGAGRSGTTLLATILNNHANIFTIGEMHQFLDYVLDDKDCSCGENLSNCLFWSPILKELDLTLIKNKDNVELSNSLEKHYLIPFYLLGKKIHLIYKKIIDMVFNTVNTKVDKPWILDSSKYISRYLLFRKNKNINLKGIYLVRDVRGVINSFGKNVQTPKKPLSAIIYYSLINISAQWVCFFDKRVLKIKYEDLVNNPDKTLHKIEAHLFKGSSKNLTISNETFTIPHIIAGNRLRSQKKLVIKKDMNWKENMSRGKQILYYFLTCPLMILNKYKP